MMFLGLGGDDLFRRLKLPGLVGISITRTAVGKPAQVPMIIALGITVGLVPGKTMFYRYSRIDPSFQARWEILYGW
jgi:hypothetical protein